MIWVIVAIEGVVIVTLAIFVYMFMADFVAIYSQNTRIANSLTELAKRTEKLERRADEDSCTNDPLSSATSTCACAKCERVRQQRAGKAERRAADEFFAKNQHRHQPASPKTKR